MIVSLTKRIRKKAQNQMETQKKEVKNNNQLTYKIINKARVHHIIISHNK